MGKYIAKINAPIPPKRVRFLMFDLSASEANFWFNISNLILFVGAVAVAIGTYGTIKMGALKEKFSDERTTELENQTANAKAELGKAQVAIAEATVRAAEANRVAEQERLERVRLEAKLAPRRLSGEQAANLSSQLASMPAMDIGVVSRLTDVEGKDFADDIANSLKGTRLRPVRIENWTKPDKGIFIATAPGTNLPNEISTLSKALTAIGIAHQTIVVSGSDMQRMSPYFEVGFIYLLIGAKP